MTTSKKLIPFAVIVALSGAPAFAQATTDTTATPMTAIQTIVDTLKGEGFVSFEVKRTWLGRYKIEAKTEDGSEREIVISGDGETVYKDETDDNHDQEDDDDHMDEDDDDDDDDDSDDDSDDDDDDDSDDDSNDDSDDDDSDDDND